MPIKRLRYFDQQFLVEADFTDEQRYHLDMRRRLTRLLHTFGIAEGLEVTRTASREVTISPGVAIDRSGREIVLEGSEVRNVSSFGNGATVFVTIAYEEAASDPTSATGITDNTRITETPKVEATTSPPPTDGTVVLLAKVTLTAGGNVPGNTGDVLDGDVRQSASVKLGSRSVDADKLSVDVANTIAGALLRADYDFVFRRFLVLDFNAGQNENATVSLPLDFSPRLVFAVSSCFGDLNADNSSDDSFQFEGNSYGFFDVSATSQDQPEIPEARQQCSVFGVTQRNANKWRLSSSIAEAICGAHFRRIEGVPRDDRFVVSLTTSSQGLTASLVRPGTQKLKDFRLSIHLWCMGR